MSGPSNWGWRSRTFVNPDGLPDPPGQLMSALDLAKLARHLINDYPQYYHYFSEKSFTWHNITQPNRDLVIATLPGADGLKTGHTDAAGYGITISAKRGNQRLILVLNGLRYPQYHNDYFPNIKRAEEAGRVMEMAFREFRSYPVFAAEPGDRPGRRCMGGAAPAVPVTVPKPLAVTMQVDSHAGDEDRAECRSRPDRADRRRPAGRHRHHHARRNFPTSPCRSMPPSAVPAPASSSALMGTVPQEMNGRQ